MTEEQMMRLFAHPLRPRLVRLLIDETRSPSDLAQLTGYSIGAVAYHVRELMAGDAIVFVRAEPRRGSLKHFYRATPFGARVVEGLDRILAEPEEVAS